MPFFFDYPIPFMLAQLVIVFSGYFNSLAGANDFCFNIESSLHKLEAGYTHAR